MTNSVLARDQQIRKGDRIRHGLISGYQHYKCRCTDCCDAKREYEKKLKLKKLEGIPELVGPKPIQHGTHNAYTNRKCRCEICSAFMRGYQMGYSKINKEAELDDLEDVPMVEKHREHGTAEAYSFGCACELCLAAGRKQWLGGGA